MDGLGDTIRVSLTEDPEFELNPCADLAAVSFPVVVTCKCCTIQPTLLTLTRTRGQTLDLRQAPFMKARSVTVAVGLAHCFDKHVHFWRRVLSHSDQTSHLASPLRVHAIPRGQNRVLRFSGCLGVCQLNMFQ